MHALIVDDSPSARELARVVLEDAFDLHDLEFEIEIVDGGMAALKAIATEEVMLLVCDLHMPDLQGLEVVSFWKERAPENGLALIVTTAVSEKDRERALQVGAAGLLDKPFSADALAPFLEQRASLWRAG